MLISLILTTDGQTEALTRSLRALGDQLLPPALGLELWLVDGDPASRVAESPTAWLPALPPRIALRYLGAGAEVQGRAPGRNRALAACQGDWVLFSDSTEALLPGALAALATAAASAEADFCTGPCLQPAPQGVAAPGGELRVEVDAAEEAALPVRNPYALGACLWRRSALRAPFDSHLRHLGDWLFLLDNLPGLRRASVTEPVLRAHPGPGAADAAALAADTLRIYALHPDAHWAAPRLQALAAQPAVAPEMLIGAPPPAVAPLQVCESPQGRFLICNPQETIQASLLRHGQFEPLASAIALAVLPLRPGAVIDVGANIGAFAVPVARAEPERPLLAIEPQRMVFMHLCANLLHNRLRNARPLQLALGRPPATASRLRVPCFDVFTERYTGSVSLDPAVQSVRGGIAGVAEPSRWAVEHETVDLRSLDEVCHGLEVAFVKIDVEGMELEVLRSGEGLLRAQAPMLFFETWQLREFEAPRRELLQYVLGLGYAVLQVGGDCFAYAPARNPAAAVLQALATLGLRLPAEAA
jgi:FkbM family methyltransferase